MPPRIRVRAAGARGVQEVVRGEDQQDREPDGDGGGLLLELQLFPGAARRH